MSSIALAPRDPLYGLPCVLSPMQIMQEAFQCPLATLRALFDASGADVNQFIMSSEQ